jgi:hypothetical protein
VNCENGAALHHAWPEESRGIGDGQEAN